MEITSEQFKLVEDLLPVQRGNVKFDNRQVLNALFYVAEHGCKWRRLPKRFGNWYSVYTRARRWAQQGVLDQIFLTLQEKDIINIQVDNISIDCSSIKAHPSALGVIKQSVDNLSASREINGQLKFIWVRLVIK